MEMVWKGIIPSMNWQTTENYRSSQTRRLILPSDSARNVMSTQLYHSRSYHLRVFPKYLVVLTQHHQKDHSMQIVEAVNPFPPFRPLAANVKELKIGRASCRERV